MCLNVLKEVASTKVQVTILRSVFTLHQTRSMAAICLAAWRALLISVPLLPLIDGVTKSNHVR